MRAHFARLLLILPLVFSLGAFADLPELDLPPAAPDPAVRATASTDATTEYKRWFILIPAFVVHGLDPTGGANRYMPRRLVPSGRSVATPGIGAEFQGRSSFEAAVAFVKDCYDNPAGTLQIGQHFRLREVWDLGYSIGLYIRKTPIACYTSTVTTTTTSAPTPPGINLGGGRRAQPSRTNTLTSTQCAFQDNLPFRYTTRVGAGYMDVIPTPFLHASVRLYHGPFDLHVMAISNFYLNEFLLSVPF
jgi:hypothetical protein